MLNLKKFHRPHTDKIWSVAECWTTQEGDGLAESAEGQSVELRPRAGVELAATIRRWTAALRQVETRVSLLGALDRRERAYARENSVAFKLDR